MLLAVLAFDNRSKRVFHGTPWKEGLELFQDVWHVGDIKLLVWTVQTGDWTVIQAIRIKGLVIRNAELYLGLRGRSCNLDNFLIHHVNDVVDDDEPVLFVFFGFECLERFTGHRGAGHVVGVDGCLVGFHFLLFTSDIMAPILQFTSKINP